MTRNSRRTTTVWIVAAVAVLALLACVEIIARIAVSNIAKDQVEQSLPDVVNAQVQASPTGWCVTCEILGGKLSGLDIETESLSANAVSGHIKLHADGVQFRDSSGADAVHGTLTISEIELNRLLAQVASQSGLDINDVNVSDRGVSYSTQFDAFGKKLDLDITASMKSRGNGEMQIVGESVEISAGSAAKHLDLDASRFTFQFCLAEYLPKELEVTSVATQDGVLTINFRSRGPVAFDGTAFTEMGRC